MTDISNLYNKTNTAVVSIHSVLNNQIIAGCGFFYKINNRNYIITAAHNIGYNSFNKTNIIKCSFTYNSIYQSQNASIVGTSWYADIAVLELKNTMQNVNTLKFSNVLPKIGQLVITIGNSLGLDHNSVSQGIVRDNNFFVNKSFPAISVSNAVYGGNSGGPMINTEGEVVSIVNAGFGEFEAYNWGVSTSLLKQIVEKIVTNNSDYNIGTLKCQYKSLDGSDALIFNITNLDGLLITKSFNNVLLKNDIIKTIEGLSITADNIEKNIIFNADNYINVGIIRNNALINRYVYVYKIDTNEDNVYGEFLNRSIKKKYPLKLS